LIVLATFGGHLPVSFECPLYPDIPRSEEDVRFVPIADIDYLFDHHVCGREQRRGDREPKRFGSLQIYDQLIFSRRLHW
jgi:hypothetical protein